MGRSYRTGIAFGKAIVINGDAVRIAGNGDRIPKAIFIS